MLLFAGLLAVGILAYNQDQDSGRITRLETTVERVIVEGGTGKQGTRGKAGAVGARGPQGVPGTQGLRGEAGSRGNAG